MLEGFIKSLSCQSFQDYHLFVIDNSPSAATDAILQNLLKRYSVPAYSHIKNSENVGVATGNNQGIEFSIKDKFDYTILLNNDIEFSQTDLLKKIVERADSSNDVMIIPKIFFWDSRKIWMAGGTLSKLKGRTYHIGEGNDDGPQYSKDLYFDYAPTCFMLIKNHLFKEIGVMDDKYFAYYDDTDFIYRAIKKGYVVSMLHSLHVFHKVSSSTGGKTSLFSIYYGTRNRIYFIRKNLNFFYFLIALFYTTVTRTITSFFYTKAQRERLWKGYFDGFKMKLKS